MDARRFDRIARDLCASNTRRGVVRLMTTIPLVSLLAALLAGPGAGATDDDHGSSHRRHRRKTRNARRSGDDKENRKGKRKDKGKHKRRGCTPTTCATQGKSCGSLADGCGGTLHCGPCATGQVCDGGTCVCNSDTCPTGCCAGTTCEEGDTEAACGDNGVACVTCHSDPNVSCRNDEWINGTCVRLCAAIGDPACGSAGSPCVCGLVFAAGEACVNQQPGNCSCFDDADTCAAECPPGRVCIAFGFSGGVCTASQMACCPACAAT